MSGFLRFGAHAALAVVVSLALACAPRTRVLSDGRYVMGTVLEISLVGRDTPEKRHLLEGLFALSASLEARFSSFDPQSQLVWLNQTAGRGVQRVDPALAELLAACVAFAHDTDGTFDITLGPLVALWNEAARRGVLPAERELAEAKTHVGVAGLRVMLPERVELLRAGMSLELGGVAKGWALDRMVERLREAGVPGAFLSFGQSSLWALGQPADGRDRWRVLVRSPGGGYVGSLALRDQALSVSQSLGQWSEIAGRRYGHVLDPRTGRPLTRSFEAVVVAPSAAQAEAWSKALLVLGPREGIARLEAQPGVEGLLIGPRGERWMTQGWTQTVEFEPVTETPSS